MYQIIIFGPVNNIEQVQAFKKCKHSRGSKGKQWTEILMDAKYIK